MTTTEQRELDAWIAEHVMGWMLLDAKAMGWIDNGEMHWATGCEANPCRRGFYPTTDPACALLVLEKYAERLEKDDRGTSLAIEWLGEIEENWLVVETDVYNGFRAQAPILPLAICLFARELFKEKTT